MKIITLNWQETIPIRHRVLWPNEAPEFCQVEGDQDALHFGVTIDEEIICVASIYIENNPKATGKTARLRKLATLPDFQGKGVGSFMLEHLVSSLKKQSINYLWFDARESALKFYLGCGFSPFGERFYKKEVAYFKMHAKLGY